MSVRKIRHTCDNCEFKKIIHVTYGLGRILYKCEIRNEWIRHPILKGYYCPWFTLDSERRKAIERYNEIQAIRRGN